MYIPISILTPILYIGAGVLLGYYFPENVESGVESVANLVEVGFDALLDYIHTITESS